MEPLSTGLTWKDVIARFSEDDALKLRLAQKSRRMKKRMRNARRRGEQYEEPGKVWRLLVQRNVDGKLETLLSKNLKDADEQLLSQTVDDAMIERLNALIA